MTADLDYAGSGDPPDRARAPWRITSTHAGTSRLQVRDLIVRFGGLTAVQDVTFAVHPGQIVALIGPNGAGKTTVFNAVCGLVRRSSGTIAVDGILTSSSPSRLRRLGVSRTLQGLGLFEGLTVLENVLVPLGSLAPAAVQRATRQLADLDLLVHADTDVAALSYPERKRVALAGALVSDPSLLLLDEPAGGLGAADIADLAEVIRRSAENGCAVLLVEHHVDFVMALADHIVVLDFGRVIAAGAPEQIRTDPRVEEAYLGVRASDAGISGCPSPSSVDRAPEIRVGEAS